jgi:hypothetical protein
VGRQAGGGHLLLVSLPHRRFVFTVPPLLRACFRPNRRLFSDIGRVIVARAAASQPTLRARAYDPVTKNQPSSLSRKHLRAMVLKSGQ